MWIGCATGLLLVLTAPVALAASAATAITTISTDESFVAPRAGLEAGDIDVADQRLEQQRRQLDAARAEAGRQRNDREQWHAQIRQQRPLRVIADDVFDQLPGTLLTAPESEQVAMLRQYYAEAVRPVLDALPWLAEGQGALEPLRWSRPTDDSEF